VKLSPELEAKCLELAGQTAPRSRPAKYRNERVESSDGGPPFSSKKEARRWADLCLLRDAGRISDLERQVPFDLVVDGVKVTRYVADAVYLEDGRVVIEDVKGVRTQAYKIKRRLVLAVLGVEIREV
jgi:hypothetical protein